MLLKGKVHYVGVNDRVKHRFEGLWLLPQGVSYNSYLIADEKATVLIDTVDISFFPEFLDKIREVLGDRPIDYLVINHMEPDHSGSISLIRQYYPSIRLIGNRKTQEMVNGFYGAWREGDICVKDKETLELGYHSLTFYLTPMLHWPETMMTFDTTEGMLFSGDAFGSFGAINGHPLDTRLDASLYWPEMERYYAAILGKFGAPVRAALKKLAPLEVKMICSTHGPVWTGEGIKRAIETYSRMAEGRTAEGLVVCYGSMYGHTQRIAEAIAEGAAEAGQKKIIVHNLSVSPPSYVLADIFRYESLAIGGPTYNGSIYPVVEDLLRRLAGRDVSAHRLACFGGFTWSSQAVKSILAYNEKMHMELVGNPLEWKQGTDAETLARARELGALLVANYCPLV